MTEKKYSLGVDIGGTYIRIGLVDLSNGKILKITKGESPIYEYINNGYIDIQPIFIETARQVRSFLDQLSEPDEKNVQQIGIAITFLVSLEKKISSAKFPESLFDVEVPIETIFKEIGKIDIPIYLINDSKAAIWAEYLFGAGKGFNNVVGITVGTGIGGGILSNGTFMQGNDGFSGNIGFLIVKMDKDLDLRVSRKSINYLENFASGTAIRENAKANILENTDSLIYELCRGEIAKITCEMVFEAYKAGDIYASKIINLAGYALGIAISTLIHALNPDIVIIGGGLPEKSVDLLSRVKKTVREYSMLNFQDTPICLAELGDSAGMIGAAFWNG